MMWLIGKSIVSIQDQCRFLYFIFLGSFDLLECLVMLLTNSGNTNNNETIQTSLSVSLTPESIFQNVIDQSKNAGLNFF